MSWLKTAREIPPVLYHATYGAYLSSILRLGLIPRYHCVWDNCENGIYLANTIDEAKSYPETAENVPDEYLDDIVVLAIQTNQLDPKKLENDPHVYWIKNPQNLWTWIYRGSIPPSAFSVIKGYAG